MKVLIADDDPANVSILQQYLTATGRTVVAAANGQEAVALFARERPDIVLLDVMMPVMEGWEVLSKIRAISRDVPVIMMTAVATTSLEAARGLFGGADDYLTKPFDFAELEARMTAILRRTQRQEQKPQILQAGPITIDDRAKAVTLLGRAITLTPKEYDLLKLFVRDAGQVLSVEQILRAIWPDNAHAGKEDVLKLISVLRHKIEEEPQSPKLIVNVRGFGYKLEV